MYNMRTRVKTSLCSSDLGRVKELILGGGVGGGGGKKGLDVMLEKMYSIGGRHYDGGAIFPSGHSWYCSQIRPQTFVP